MSVAVRPRRPAVSAAQVFHALSDDTRLAVMEMLRDGERCVCDLQGALDAAQSRLSFHLKVLKDAGLVTDRKEGRWSYYTLNAERLAEASTVLNTLATASPSVDGMPLHSLARSSKVGQSARAERKRVAAGGDACCGSGPFFCCYRSTFFDGSFNEPEYQPAPGRNERELLLADCHNAEGEVHVGVLWRPDAERSHRRVLLRPCR